MTDNAHAADGSGMPECMNVEPRAEHRWLSRFAGDWTYTSRMMNPDGTELVTTGRESVRMLGDIWYVAEGDGEMPGGDTAQMVMTIGFDPARDCFVGSWYGTMMTLFWVYEGRLSEDGNSLHLQAQGPDFSGGEATKLYRDTIEYVNDGHRRLRSALQGEDGQWHEFMVADYHRA